MMERNVGKALQGAVENLRDAQREVTEAIKRAEATITADSQVRRHLGGSVRVGEGVSSQISTQSLNGRSTKTVHGQHTRCCCLNPIVAI